MPDPVLILEASALAAVLAALLSLVGRLRPAWASGSAAVGIAAGVIAGSWVLGLAPQFPPVQDRDRFLLIVLPAAALAEATAGRARWLLRSVVAAAAAPVLLHGSAYVADVAGPGSREWSVQQTAAIFAGLAVALAAAQVSLDRLTSRAGRSTAIALATVGLVAAVTVMLSGYATGGQLGFPLAAGLVGAAVVSTTLGTATGVGVVGLFALLVVGRFFGNLTTTNAALLFAAPLLGWLPEVPPLGRLKPWVRGTARVLLTAAPAAVAVALAVQQFSANSAGPSTTPDAQAPSASDYLNFGK